MGLKFKSPLELSGHRAIQHTDVAQTLVVKVVTKTNAHPEYGNGSTYGYTIDGFEAAYLEFYEQFIEEEDEEIEQDKLVELID